MKHSKFLQCYSNLLKLKSGIKLNLHKTKILVTDKKYKPEHQPFFTMEDHIRSRCVLVLEYKKNIEHNAKLLSEELLHDLTKYQHSENLFAQGKLSQQLHHQLVIYLLQVLTLSQCTWTKIMEHMYYFMSRSQTLEEKGYISHIPKQLS